MHSFLATLVVLVALTHSTQAQDFQPRRLEPPKAEMVLVEILADLETQTGNRVLDLRTTKRTNPKLNVRPGTFWQTLEAVGDQTGIGVSAYAPNGGVALVDAPFRKLTTYHAGAFRFSLKRMLAARDDETQTHQVQMTLDAAWEPRLALLYLNLENAHLVADKKKHLIERQALRSVAGASAAEIELRAPAPPRSVQQIDSLKGEIRVIGAPKMLEFAFDKLGPVNPKSPRDAKPQDEVQLRLLDVKQATARWTVKLQISNPPGAIVPLESFQSWLDNNRLWLTWTDKAGKQQTLEPVGETQDGTSEKMTIHFDFTAKGDTPLPTKDANVTLRYRTPNRVMAFTVPFEFQNLPLP